MTTLLDLVLDYDPALGADAIFADLSAPITTKDTTRFDWGLLFDRLSKNDYSRINAVLLKGATVNDSLGVLVSLLNAKSLDLSGDKVQSLIADAVTDGALSQGDADLLAKIGVLTQSKLEQAGLPKVGVPDVQQAIDDIAQQAVDAQAKQDLINKFQSAYSQTFSQIEDGSVATWADVQAIFTGIK